MTSERSDGSPRAVERSETSAHSAAGRCVMGPQQGVYLRWTGSRFAAPGGPSASPRDDGGRVGTGGNLSGSEGPRQHMPSRLPTLLELIVKVDQTSGKKWNRGALGWPCKRPAPDSQLTHHGRTLSAHRPSGPGCPMCAESPPLPTILAIESGKAYGHCIGCGDSVRRLVQFEVVRHKLHEAAARGCIWPSRD